MSRYGRYKHFAPVIEWLYIQGVSGPKIAKFLGLRANVTIATDGTVTWSVSADIVLAAGDWLTLIAPATADTTISDPHVTFVGTLS